MSLDHQNPWPLPQTAAEFPGTVWMEVTDQKKVIHKYWSALRIYLLCLLARFPDHRNEADDLLQEFILKKILQPGWLENANPEKGRFRDFLKSSLRNFVVGEIRARDAEKRGGKSTPGPLEDLELPAPEENAEFDMAWLRMLLAEALQQMEASCAAAESTHVWRIFQHRVIRPALDSADPMPYEMLVAQLGFKSPSQATNALATGKRMFARHLRAVIAQYETGDQAVRAELEALQHLLHRLLPGKKPTP